MSDLQFYQIDYDEAYILFDKKTRDGWNYSEGDCLTQITVRNDKQRYWNTETERFTYPVWGLEECVEELRKPLNITDKMQQKAREAFEFFNLLFNYVGPEREPLVRLGLLQEI